MTEFDPQRRIVKLAPRPPGPSATGGSTTRGITWRTSPTRSTSRASGTWIASTGLLSYWPLSGEDPTKAEVVAPVVCQTLVSFKGDPAAKRYIEYLRFQGHLVPAHRLPPGRRHADSMSRGPRSGCR